MEFGIRRDFARNGGQWFANVLCGLEEKRKIREN